MRNVKFTGMDWYEILNKCPITEHVGGSVTFLGFNLATLADAVCVLAQCSYCGHEHPTMPYCSKCGAYYTDQKYLWVKTLNEAIETIWG